MLVANCIALTRCRAANFLRIALSGCINPPPEKDRRYMGVLALDLHVGGQQIAGT